MKWIALGLIALGFTSLFTSLNIDTSHAATDGSPILEAVLMGLGAILIAAGFTMLMVLMFMEL